MDPVGILAEYKPDQLMLHCWFYGRCILSSALHPLPWPNRRAPPPPAKRRAESPAPAIDLTADDDADDEGHVTAAPPVRARVCSFG